MLWEVSRTVGAKDRAADGKIDEEVEGSKGGD
jgi:hypothetical protein